MGAIEKIQEMLDKLLIKVEGLEAVILNQPKSIENKKIIGVREFCEELGISRAQFERDYRTLPFWFRLKDGGALKCQVKDFEKWKLKQFES